MVVPSSISIGGAKGSTSNRYDLRRRQLQRRRLCSISFLMRLLLVVTAFAFLSNAFLHFYWHYHNSYQGATTVPLEEKASVSSFLSPEAYPVYGIRADLKRKNKGNSKPVSVVYAIPSGNHEQQGLSNRKPLGRIKGIVVLLHACTHTALKFFAPSSTCPDCIGLSEEMRLARIVLERGYAAVAVTASSKGGCWGGDNDVEAIRTALGSFRDHWLHAPGGGALEFDDPPTVYALGASSGGTMAAKLVAEGVVESAAVMVMGLRDQLLDKILSLPEEPARKLYLAPMTRDKRTAKSVRGNYVHWTKEQGKHQKQHVHEMLVDEVSCVPLPVTANYLWNRVPGMTLEAAQTIVRVLLENKHLDPSTMKLIVDPTQSSWRDFFLQGDLPVPETLRLSQEQKQENIVPNGKNNNNNKMVLWETFDLTPGISPLAKALHRAWAMHEYCSEIVEYALDFFEGQKTKQEILDILQQH